MRLERLVIDRAREAPDAPAISAPGESLSYGQLDRLCWRITRVLADIGVGPGGRVCLWLDKSATTVAIMQAVLRTGAAYVPLDPLSPRARIARMLADCQPRLLVTTEERAHALLGSSEAKETGPGTDALTGHVSGQLAGHLAGQLPCLVVDGTWRGRSWADLLASASDAPRPGIAPGQLDADALAYILYTSGSTGTPKGVCISHGNAWAFIEWAATIVDAHSNDRLSNHAPFHFDLSVFDLYVAFLVGAHVSLAPTTISYAPSQLVHFLAEQRITIWYSVPSALAMMMESGGLLEADDVEPRVVVFAGEAFPMPQLLMLRRHWRKARFFNFYGPTETNVCTAYELPDDDPDAVLAHLPSVPIGTAASGDRVWLETSDGKRVLVGGQQAAGRPDELGGNAVGEVVVDGPTVMLGYWGREPHRGPYRTGDRACLNDAGLLEFLGRRDQMVKVRGHRIELGEIEATLQRHPAIREAAVAVAGTGRHARLIAVLVARGDSRPSLLAIKRQCAENLPRYMIVDRVQWCPALPRTGNGKLDRRRLLEA